MRGRAYEAIVHYVPHSELKNFATSPARWIKGYKSEQSDEMSWGDKLDCLIFTPSDSPEVVVVAPATYPAKASAEQRCCNH